MTSAIRYQRMKARCRASAAFFLLATYLSFAMTPLAPLVLKSPRLAHAITGECAGDCDICGCSPERRATRTCCCWIGKMKRQQDHDRDNIPECCRKKLRARKMLSNGPCGSSKQLGLYGSEKTEQLPCRFAETIPIIYEGLHTAVENFHLVTCYREPPDPPPKS